MMLSSRTSAIAGSRLPSKPQEDVVGTSVDQRSKIPKKTSVRGSVVFQSLTQITQKVARSFAESGADIVEVKGELPIHSFFFNHPEMIHQIYTHKTIGTTKPPKLLQREAWFMRGELVSDPGGPSWKRKRKLLAPLFSPQKCSEFFKHVPAAIQGSVSRIKQQARSGTPVPIQREMRLLITDLAFKMFFSHDLGNRLEEISRKIGWIEHHFQSFIPLWFPLPENLKFKQYGRQLIDCLTEILQARKAEKDPPRDYLHSIMNRQDDHLGRTWNDKEIVNEMLMIIGANALVYPLTWGLYLTARHPLVYRRLEKELRSTLVTASPGDFIPGHDQGLSYLDAVLKETIRVNPPFWGSARYSRKPVEFFGIRFPARSMFVTQRYLAHRHPDFWENPHAFDPDRFLPPNRSKIKPHAYLPFGSGPRTCLGVHMSMPILKMIFSSLLKQFRFNLKFLAPNDEPRLEFKFGLFPKGEILMGVDEIVQEPAYKG